MTDLKLVIMAAGLGSRFGGLKQIHELGPSGEFLMDYAIYDAYQAGVKEVCLVVQSHFKEQIEIVINSRWESYKDLTFSFVCQDVKDLPSEFNFPQREKPWGTTHVLYALRNAIKGPFLIMNADDFYGRNAIQSLASSMMSKKNEHAFVAYPLKETLSPHGSVTRGVCEIENGFLKNIDEVKEIYSNDNRGGFVSMNLWGFSPEVFTLINEQFKKFLKEKGDDLKAEYQIPQVVNDLLQESKIKISSLETDSPWFGVTYKEDEGTVRNKIAKLVSDGVYPESLFKVDM